MLQDKIKALRKARGMSQEELAASLHVVRQTISKYENGQSVPDADILMKMAEVFQVSVSELLEKTDVNQLNAAEELERINQILAEKIQIENSAKKANRVREKILFLSFLGMFFSLIFDDALSLACMGICMTISLILLYRNVDVLCRKETKEAEAKYIKITTLFNLGILLTCVALAIAMNKDMNVISEKVFAFILISILMVFCGYICPKLPFNRYTGLRLPWTIRDEETWILAHRILGVISLPMVMIYLMGCILHISFETLSITVIAIWILIPSLISFLYYNKKMYKIKK